MPAMSEQASSARHPSIRSTSSDDENKSLQIDDEMINHI